MISLRFMVVALLGAGAFALGCVGAPDDDVAGLDMQVPVQPQAGTVGGNGMFPLDFWAQDSQAALRRLGSGALLDSGGALAATSLLDSPGGRSVLGYTIRCALPQGTMVTSASGIPFRGSLGLAQGWTGGALSTSEQRWMTACLLQHLNGLGRSVDIMMEGSHPGLDPIPGQDTSNFTVRDATMFGNLFLSVPRAYACIDLDIQLACGLDLSLHTVERLCGLSPCGVIFVGVCGLFCANNANGDPTCRLPLLGPTYAESIRTKVADTDLISLYPGCDVL